MLLMPAAYSFVHVPSQYLAYLSGDSELPMESDQTSATAAVVTWTEEQLIAEIISQVSEEEIYQSVYDLQNFKTRAYGYPGNTAASTYIYNRFDSIPELNVEYQGGDLRNVIATLPGLNTSSNEIYMVGAHYDSTSSDPNNAPGALDDASGVAIVLEFARIMSQYNFNHTLKFACWNREENGLIGSRNFTAYASNNSFNISLYVNLDSPAYDPDSRFILDIMYNNQSTWAANMLTEHNSLYGIDFTLTYNVHNCGSDHQSFWSYGYTAVMTHEETHGPAHTPNDTVDKVSTLYAKKNGQLCMSVLARVAEATNVEVHDVEALSVTPSKTVAAKGSPISISLKVRNSGSYSETFTVTTRANAQTLNLTQISLAARTSMNFSFPWNTTSFTLGSYVITTYASPVVNETDLADNNCTGGNVTITITGDINGDFTVDIYDAILLSGTFNTIPGEPTWNPNVDLNSDNIVDIFDAIILANHFGTKA
jgi:hypothetical protein